MVVNFASKKLGLPGGKATASLATKLINKNLGKSGTRTVKSSVSSQPAAKSLVKQRSSMPIVRSPLYEFTFAKLNSDYQFGFLICPWQTYGYSGSTATISWDPQLLLDLESKREYRVLHASLEYLGTAPTTATNLVYMGGAKDPNTDLPNQDEFSMLECFHNGPMYEPGATISLPHDSEWHGINTDITFTSPTTDKKLFAAGVGFIQQTGSTYSGRYSLKLQFEFRGKDPVVSIPQYQIGAITGTALSTLPAAVDNLVGPCPQNTWTYAANPGGLGTCLQVNPKPGYYFVDGSIYGFGDSGFTGSLGWKVVNSSNADVSATQVKQKGGEIRSATTSGISFWFGGVLINEGDTLNFQYTATDATEDLYTSLKFTRCNQTKLNALDASINLAAF